MDLTWCVIALFICMSHDHWSWTSFHIFGHLGFLFCELPVDILNPFFFFFNWRSFLWFVHTVNLLLPDPKQTQIMALLCSGLLAALSRTHTAYNLLSGPGWPVGWKPSSAWDTQLHLLQPYPPHTWTPAQETPLALSQASCTHRTLRREHLPRISTFHLNATFSVIVTLAPQFS